MGLNCTQEFKTHSHKHHQKQTKLVFILLRKTYTNTNNTNKSYFRANESRHQMVKPKRDKKVK